MTSIRPVVQSSPAAPQWPLKTPELAHRAGCTYREIQWWIEQGLLTPVKNGGEYEWWPGDFFIASTMKALRVRGVSRIKVAAEIARAALRAPVRYLLISLPAFSVHAAKFYEADELIRHLTQRVGPYAVLDIDRLKESGSR